jgi:chemotaxis protein histidine kinase CheA/ActR/RegA family two-component response regulator
MAEQDRILGYFLDEAQEHLRTIEEALIVPTSLAEVARIKEVFRAAHSIKGGAAMLGLETVQQIGNHFEQTFKAIKDRSITVDEKLQDNLLEGLEILRLSIQLVQYGQTPPPTMGQEPVFAKIAKRIALVSGAQSSAVDADLPFADPAIEQVFCSYVGQKLQQFVEVCQKTQPEAITKQELHSICQKIGNLGERFEYLAWTNLLISCRLAVNNPLNSVVQLRDVIPPAVKQAQILVTSGRQNEITITPELEILLAPNAINSTRSFTNLAASDGLELEPMASDWDDIVITDEEISEAQVNPTGADFLFEPQMVATDNPLDPSESEDLEDFMQLFDDELAFDGTWVQEEDVLADVIPTELAAQPSDSLWEEDVISRPLVASDLPTGMNLPEFDFEQPDFESDFSLSAVSQPRFEASNLDVGSDSEMFVEDLSNTAISIPVVSNEPIVDWSGLLADIPDEVIVDYPQVPKSVGAAPAAPEAELATEPEVASAIATDWPELPFDLEMVEPFGDLPVFELPAVVATVDTDDPFALPEVSASVPVEPLASLPAKIPDPPPDIPDWSSEKLHHPDFQPIDADYLKELAVFDDLLTDTKTTDVDLADLEQIIIAGNLEEELDLEDIEDFSPASVNSKVSSQLPINFDDFLTEAKPPLNNSANSPTSLDPSTSPRPTDTAVAAPPIAMSEMNHEQAALESDLDLEDLDMLGLASLEDFAELDRGLDDVLAGLDIFDVAGAEEAEADFAKLFGNNDAWGETAVAPAAAAIVTPTVTEPVVPSGAIFAKSDFDFDFGDQPEASEQNIDAPAWLDDLDDDLLGDMSGLELADESLTDMSSLNLDDDLLGDMSGLELSDESLTDMSSLNLDDDLLGDMSGLELADESLIDMSSLNLDDDLLGDMSGLELADESLIDMSSLNLDDDLLGDMSGLELADESLGDLNGISALSNDEIDGINALGDLDSLWDGADVAANDLGDLDNLLSAEDTFDGLDSLLDAAPVVATVAVGIAATGAITAAEMSLAASGQSMTIPALAEPAKPTVAPTRSNKQRTFEQTMRVSVKNLNNLNNLTGELVVNRNTLEQDQNRMRQFIDKLLLEVQKLNEVGKSMQDLYEKSLLENSLIASRQQSKSMVPGSNNDSEYDPLEMDKFTPVHLISQQMIELTVRIRESTSDIEFVVDSSTEVTRSLRQITSQLQEDLNKSRMLPFSQTSDRLQRGVRDNGLKYGKEVELVVEGSDTLIDKVILESLNDPLIHMVNNAIAHGIETPAERLAVGKPAEGVISIKAIHQGTQTLISIKDDGAGIDTERVKAKAIEKGIITPARSVTMTQQEVYELLFLPSFSTKDQADELAGRGVGMDVVLSSLQEIRGTITTESKLGQGTTFTIRLPLALSITKALMASNKDVGIAFPLDGIEDSLTVKPYSILENEAGQKCFPWRDQLMPFRPLSELLAFNRPMKRVNYYGAGQEGTEETVSIVVLRTAGTLVAVEVDRVLGEQEIVIKPLQGPAPKPLGIAGATVLGDGRIIPIADVLELVDLATGKIELRNAQSWSIGDIPEEQPTQREPMVLVVDDSITVRQLLSLTFTKAGYRVEQARDGQEAWDKLRAGLPCDIIFCDIEMPRMDGLELLSKVQGDEVLRQIPMAMLTSRGSDRHRQIASQLGASGYFIKPYLEDALLEAVKRMLKGEVLAIV